jgi:hypothetical protein
VTLMLNLPGDLETRLSDEARRKGVAVEAYAADVLAKHVARRQRQTEAVALLQSWIEDPAGQEQEETGKMLVKALDEDRPSERKLYPPELKGVTW